MTQSHLNPVLDFMLTRRSRPAAALKSPAPDADALTQLLTAAARVPDHGKLEPWRFLILEGAALTRLSDLIRTRGPVLGIAPEKIEKSALSWANAPLIVAVISSPKPSEKVPELEQMLSAGAVCLGIVNAALATGWSVVDCRCQSMMLFADSAAVTMKRSRCCCGCCSCWQACYY